jgi:hypothetical protein
MTQNYDRARGWPKRKRGSEVVGNSYTKMPSFSKLLAAAALVASATADFHLSRTFETVNNINGSVS